MKVNIQAGQNPGSAFYAETLTVEKVGNEVHVVVPQTEGYITPASAQAFAAALNQESGAPVAALGVNGFTLKAVEDGATAVLSPGGLVVAVIRPVQSWAVEAQ